MIQGTVEEVLPLARAHGRSAYTVCSRPATTPGHFAGCDASAITAGVAAPACTHKRTSRRTLAPLTPPNSCTS